MYNGAVVCKHSCVSTAHLADKSNCGSRVRTTERRKCKRASTANYSPGESKAKNTAVIPVRVAREESKGGEQWKKNPKS